jgi:hypothetical protein
MGKGELDRINKIHKIGEWTLTGETGGKAEEGWILEESAGVAEHLTSIQAFFMCLMFLRSKFPLPSKLILSKNLQASASACFAMSA